MKTKISGKKLKKIIFHILLLVITNTVFSFEIKWLNFEKGVKKAKAENKLILMDIYAKWCHWCNVIENTTYRDKRVIEIINKYYIPIRVNAEKRPDINKKYNQGGLPSTVILDNNGDILFGAIYIPPNDMVKLLKFYASLDKEKLKEEVERVKLLTESRFNRLKKSLKDKKINKKYLEKVFKYIKIRYDYQYGALKGAPKFPKTNLPYFLMLYWIFFDNLNAKKLAVDTLYAYSKLIDNVEGGLYRYSVNEYWTEFHYEKLLKDQAQLAVLYFNGYAIFGKEDFKIYANKLINFAKNKLYDLKTGYFYNSQGADIVDDKGTLLITGEEYFPRDKEGRQLLENAVGYPPKIEKQIYFANNLLIAKALAYSYIFNENQKDLKIAKKIIENILKDGFSKRGIIHSKNVEKYYLNTQVYFLDTVLILYEITGELKYLNLAEKIFSILNKHYYSKNLSIFVDLTDTGINIKNISFIDDIFALNAKLVKLFYKLATMTESKKYYKTALKLVKKLPAKANINTAIAYFVIIYKPVLTRIIGFENDKKEFVKTSFKVFPFFAFSQFIDKNNKEFLNEIGYIFEGETKAYICNIEMCFFGIEKRDLINLKRKIFEIYTKIYKMEN
ncbi:MAG TPA: thioredoxin domain-containing protein [Hydrogenothermaceae bacterium]|nr:thioredoxin domain-containing protein [Hydrogenothermaceae bacterium]